MEFHYFTVEGFRLGNCCVQLGEVAATLTVELSDVVLQPIPEIPIEQAYFLINEHH